MAWSADFFWRLLLSGSKWKCPGCAAINPVEFYGCYMCCEGVDDERWRAVERDADQVVVANGECHEGGRGRVPRQSVRTGGGEGGFVATQGLGLGMEPGEEWEEWELWEEMQVPDEACGVGENALAVTGPGQDASQVVEAMAEWEAE